MTTLQAMNQCLLTTDSHIASVLTSFTAARLYTGYVNTVGFVTATPLLVRFVDSEPTVYGLN